MKFHRKEREIQKECKHILEKYHEDNKVYSLRTHPYKGVTKTGAYVDTCRKGCPDFTVLINGRYVGFEIKTTAKHSKQDEKQVEAQEHIEKCGGYYFLVVDYTEVRDIVERLLKL